MWRRETARGSQGTRGEQCGGRDKLEQSILTHLYENTIRKPISNVKINSHEGRPLDYLLRDEGVISVWFPAV